MVRLLAVLLILWATPGHSSPWTVTDLGRLYKEHHCMQAARRTFEIALAEFRVDRIRASDWVTYADSINGRHDALITCTYGDNRGTRATLVIHTPPQSAQDRYLVRRLRSIFDEQSALITQAWKDSFQ